MADVPTLRRKAKRYAKSGSQYMNKKYLYGKKQFLEATIKGEGGLRFSDISHYSRLENELMRDEETSKQFSIDRYTTRLEVNGFVLNPDDMVDNPIFSIPVRHCYCLCLSNRKNSEELFDKFDADLCIEIDSDKLLEALKFAFSHTLKGMEVQARDIIYYDPIKSPPTLNSEDLVFHKPHFFRHEAEFRVALFYPINKKGFKAKGDITVPFILEDESMHISISHSDPRFITQFILGVTERDEIDA